MFSVTGDIKSFSSGTCPRAPKKSFCWKGNQRPDKTDNVAIRLLMAAKHQTLASKNWDGVQSKGAWLDWFTGYGLLDAPRGCKHCCIFAVAVAKRRIVWNTPNYTEWDRMQDFLMALYANVCKLLHSTCKCAGTILWKGQVATSFTQAWAQKRVMSTYD